MTEVAPIRRPARPGGTPPRADDPNFAVWLAAIATGDRAAFRAFYDVTSPRLFPLALRLMRDRAAAEDAMQEAYLRVWTRAATFQPERGAAMPWLFRILRNIAYDRLAADRPGEVALDEVAETLAGPMRRPEVGLDLARGLAQLAPSQRQAVILAILQGATAPDIARRMRIPLGTAKCWVQRGLRRLRLEMAGDKPAY